MADYLAAQIGAGLLRDEDPTLMAELLISMCAAQQNKLLWGVGLMDDERRNADAVRFSEYFLRLFGAASAPSAAPVTKRLRSRTTDL